VRCIAGLGNPGKEYTETRHNLGYMVLDRFAEREKIRFSPGKGEWWEGYKRFDDTGVYLIKPTTFMNNSGIALLDCLNKKKISSDCLLVVFDDAELPLGKIRIRAQGSSGGHKGLESIIYHLGTENFSRLRIGIGRGEGDLADWVLSPFTSEEMETIKKSIETAYDAILLWIKEGVEKTMDRYNPDVKHLSAEGGNL